jgi:IS605 OrfB family transposase
LREPDVAGETATDAGSVRCLVGDDGRFNAACNTIAVVAFRARTANKIRLQQLVYPDIRWDFGLSAQLTVRAISKVAEAYQRDKRIQPTFRSHGAIVYDQRVLSWKGLDRVSILTLTGRQVIPVVLDGYHRARLNRIRGQADLTYRDGQFYLAVVVEVPEPPPFAPDDRLGADLGIRNLAADSDGETYWGGQVHGLRQRQAKLRQRLQKKGTKSAKRLLKKRRNKEHRFATDVNHQIAKRLGAKAQDTGRGIAREDLQGIRERVTVRKTQRRIQHSWAFHQLRAFSTRRVLREFRSCLWIPATPRGPARNAG